jgi:hypothetical protein
MGPYSRFGSDGDEEKIFTPTGNRIPVNIHTWCSVMHLGKQLFAFNVCVPGELHLYTARRRHRMWGSTPVLQSQWGVWSDRSTGRAIASPSSCTNDASIIIPGLCTLRRKLLSWQYWEHLDWSPASIIHYSTRINYSQTDFFPFMYRMRQLKCYTHCIWKRRLVTTMHKCQCY